MVRYYLNLEAGTLPKINLINFVKIMPPYVHVRRQLDEYVMYIIVSGTMNIVENGITYNLKENDVIILSPEYEHYGLDATECEYYYIHFNADIVKKQAVEEDKERLISLRFESLRTDEVFGMRDEDIVIPNYFHFTNLTSITNLLSKTGELIDAGKDKIEYFTNKSDCMLLNLLIDLSRAYVSEIVFQSKTTSTKSSRRVYELLNYFNSNYMNDISGDTIESVFECNFDYLNRVFKKAIGKTIFNYLNELRILKSKILLDSGLYSLNDVADMTGFSDAYYFSKVFKKYTGNTPGKYSRDKKREREWAAKK